MGTRTAANIKRCHYTVHKMPFKMYHMFTLLGWPLGLADGINGSRMAHSTSKRSQAYGFMANNLLTFHCFLTHMPLFYHHFSLPADSLHTTLRAFGTAFNPSALRAGAMLQRGRISSHQQWNGTGHPCHQNALPLH